METNKEENTVLLGGIEYPLCNQEDDYLASVDGCTYTKLVSFDNWAYQEACRRWEIIKHRLTDLRIGPLWHRNENIIEYPMGYRYSTHSTPRWHKDESNGQDSDHVRFDWDRDFFDIE
ncbi:hypothetical protein FPANT_11079 [Fusarium pseudoanthophilum]|uniref:Uncharacterized protein n=1 Tax=Fusarium pseudoanthophilum TaxID=48495 RepID=A0A8H5KN17_9HYPO|nr:hypothetical protein FPANT_11079 [Fusarium pseudoanthophilum]